jgi:hypothetical protein
MSIREVETVEATATTPLLLQPAAFRGVTLRNRSEACAQSHFYLFVLCLLFLVAQ